MKVKKTAEKQFQIEKPRYNAFQSGTGVVIGKKEKLNNRNSKKSKALKQSLKTFCY